MKFRDTRKIRYEMDIFIIYGSPILKCTNSIYGKSGNVILNILGSVQMYNSIR